AWHERARVERLAAAEIVVRKDARNRPWRAVCEFRARNLQRTTPHERRSAVRNPRTIRMLRPWLLAAIGALAAASFAAADEGPEVKWHPGHYMLVYLGDSQALRLRRLAEIGDETVLQGAQVRYRWADLEPRKDV